MLLEKLAKLANELDELGHKEAADEIDVMLKAARAKKQPVTEKKAEVCSCQK